MALPRSDRREFLRAALASSLLASSFSFVDASSLFGAEPASSLPDVDDSPYGVCAHINIGEEWELAPKNLLLMKEAGIRWVRSDFSWSAVEPAKGQWDFAKLDKIVDETTKLGLQILPILDYDVSWASPAFQHLEDWLNYVKTVVERYKDRIRYWEVWNEENADGFWQAKANGADYATLLRETYKAIKAIAPELVVLYGGLAGTPCDFFEASLDAGAGEFFDVINIHPYRGGIVAKTRVEVFRQDIAQFRAALAKRNIAPKPVWITEMGWATPPIFGEVDHRIISAAIQHLFKNETPRIAYFNDDRYDPSLAFSKDDFASLLPAEYRKSNDLLVEIDLDGLQKVDPQEYPILAMPPSETFPANRFASMTEYVKNGGVLVLLGGVPLYYESWPNESGRYVQGPHNPNFARDTNAMRISWYAWWTRENVPDVAQAVPAPESFDLIVPEGRAAYEQFKPRYEVGRFFDDAKLKDGDRMIPLVNGVRDDFTGCAACIYDFNSDYKGAIVIAGIYSETGASSNTSTVENQAVYLTQAILLSLAFDVERYFWYEFQAPERDNADKEHHFGIVGQKLDPKPAYYAYKALTQARPAGSSNDAVQFNEYFCLDSWKRPDGKKCWALWTYRNTRKATLRIEGNVEQAFDYLGNEIAKPSDDSTIEISTGAAYFIGPDKISLE